MKRRITVVTLMLGMLLATTALAVAQSEGSSSVESPVAVEPGSSPLPILTIINSVGEEVPVRVEIADTDAERQTGLMGRTILEGDAGMLFVFDQEQMLSFWMKDTLIPLSIAYIDSEGRIVDIQDMQPLDDLPPQYVSAEPAQYTLEVNQGFFEERGVTVGDMVELPGQGEEVSVAPHEAPEEAAPDGTFSEEV
jgi:uncharacterized membrane protein (UPF0127 family)